MKLNESLVPSSNKYITSHFSGLLSCLSFYETTAMDDFQVNRKELTEGIIYFRVSLLAGFG